MMLGKSFTYLVAALVTLSGLVMNVAFADYSVPVSHTHEGREHNHQLPKEGVYHRHGIGERGQPIRHQNKVIYSNTTITSNTKKPSIKAPKPPKPKYSNTPVSSDTNLHTHSGRQHSHALPNQGVYHRHGSGATGQAVISRSTGTVVNRSSGTTVNNSSGTVVFDDIQNAPVTNSNYSGNNNSVSTNGTLITGNVSNNNQKSWNRTQGFDKYLKGSTQCPPGKTDCNVCAVNVQQQFQKAAAKQISWQRKRWNFRWPQAYPPENVRPLDVFDGDAKYALGIPDTHVQGFVRTNSRQYPYAGSHSHKRTGGIFVVKQGANGDQYLSSLHKTTGRHPSGVQIIGKYLIYGEGTRLFFKDMNSHNQDNDFRLVAPGAKFGGGLAIIKLARDNHLLITTGPGGQKKGTRFNRFYHLKSINGRPSSVRFINESTTKKPQQWPAILAFSENMSLITECGTGDIYSIHTTGDEQGIAAISGKGYWRLSKLVSNGKALGLTAVNAFTSGQDMKRCNIRASATVNVNPQNRLEFLCHAYAKDPDGSGFNVLGKTSRDKDKFYYNVGVVR